MGEGGGGGLRSGVPQHLLYRRCEKTKTKWSNFISWRKLRLQFFLTAMKNLKCLHIHLCSQANFPHVYANYALYSSHFVCS